MSLSTSILLSALGILDYLIPGYLYLSFLMNRSSSEEAVESTSSEMISAALSLLVAVCVEKVLRFEGLFARLFVLNFAVWFIMMYAFEVLMIEWVDGYSKVITAC